MTEQSQVGEILARAKKAAIEYHVLTGKPLGITGEIAEYEAASKLKLELSNARQPGYDAIRVRDGIKEKIQIKGRMLPNDSKLSQRVGSIRFDHDWDYVVLVLLNEVFEPVEMYEADRLAIRQALKKPGSKARNERGALAISKFKSLSRLVWPRDRGTK